MSYKAIYTYAWDLADGEAAETIGWFRALGLDTVTIAGSYHAGKFLRPKGKNGKVYFPEDGTVYFHPNPSRYGAIKPIENSLLRQRDIIRELTHSRDIAVNLWLVLLHNSVLGAAHPEATVTNAFGDHYVYSLCPSSPLARAYAIGLVSDVTENYAVSGVSLESCGFAPYAHGFHHEFALLRSNRWLEQRLGLCFCEHCLAGARGAGVDAERLRVQIAEDVDAYLESDVDFPADMAEAFWLADTRSDGALKAFLDWRCAIVTSLVAEIRAAVRPEVNVAVIPSVARPTGGAWYEGSDLAALAAAAGILEACFYEPTAMRVKSDLFDLRRRVGDAGKIRGIMRPAYPDIENRGEFVEACRALAAGGVKEIAFYNYGHLRTANLGWIADALRAMANA
ncbi:MAG TPA: hypothetical protein VII20_10460 [Roseiarcus sp.]|jgi:hypothetical protein